MFVRPLWAAQSPSALTTFAAQRSPWRFFARQRRSLAFSITPTIVRSAVDSTPRPPTSLVGGHHFSRSTMGLVTGLEAPWKPLTANPIRPTGRLDRSRAPFSVPSLRRSHLAQVVQPTVCRLTVQPTSTRLRGPAVLVLTRPGRAALSERLCSRFRRPTDDVSDAPQCPPIQAALRCCHREGTAWNSRVIADCRGHRDNSLLALTKVCRITSLADLVEVLYQRASGDAGV